MGGQNAKPPIPMDILRAETDYLITKSRCSPEMEQELNREIDVMLTSLDPSIKLPTSSLSALGTGVLNQRIDTEVKGVLLDQINEFEVSREVNERFFDSNLFSVLGCLYANLLTIDKQTFQATPFVSTYFRPTDNLSIGQWGIVLRAKNGGSEMSFIIKTQTNPNETDLSIHEAFIATVCTNKLRALCPNFSYLYGGFACGKPDGISAKICTDQQTVPYAVYENVTGPTFGKFLHEMPPSIDVILQSSLLGPPASPLNISYLIVLSTLLQMFFALKIAQAKAYQFSHRDLHADNIILRPFPRTAIIKYDSNSYIPEDVLETIQIKMGQRPPRQPLSDVRQVYYIKANYIATVIDYDMAEAYLPYQKPDGTYGVRQHGIPDRDPINKVITGQPSISHIRDLAKLLGFTANSVLNNKAVGNDFKELLCDLYIDTLRPYYTITAPANRPVPTIQDKVKLIIRDASNRFTLTDSQIYKIQSGEIAFDKFLTNFTRLVPYLYTSELITLYNIDPQIDYSVETVLKDRTGLEILGCSNDCPTETDTYRKLTAPSYQKEALALQQDTRQRPEVLAFQLSDAYLSELRFQQSPVQVSSTGPNAIEPENKEKTIQYRQLTQQRFREFAKLATPETLRALDSKIQMQSGLLDGMIGLIKLPDPALFPRDVNLHREELRKYRAAINSLFDITKLMREIIIMHNATVIINAPFATKNRPIVMRLNTIVNQLFQIVIYPWRDMILERTRRNAFGKSTDEMAIVIATKLPASVTFDPIF